MDLLFNRYASPFDYLNVLIEYGNFARGVANIWDEYQDQKNWELYLSLNPLNEKSFTEWKKDMQTRQGAKTPMSRAEIDATVEKSQMLLKGFNPRENE
ncbi:MAG: hypothetical protein IIX02_03585 [Clostridia bacterium]|nr:hypothetical protein [Clostridia bacterium]